MRIINYYPDRETVDDAFYQLAQIFKKDILLRDFSTERSLYKIFIKKAEKKKDPLFMNSPLLERVKIELAFLERRYYGKLIAD